MDIDANVISMVEPDRGSEMNEVDFSKWFLSLDDYKNITVLLDTEDIAKNEFGVRAYPTMVYLDADGSVVKVQPGHQDKEQIIETLENIREG
jgi:thioredoxin-related protein